MAKKKPATKSRVAKLGRKIGGLKRSVRVLKKKVSGIKPRRRKSKTARLGRRIGGLKRSVRALKKKVGKLKPRKAKARVVRAPARNIRITVAAARARKRKPRVKRKRRAAKNIRITVAAARPRARRIARKKRIIRKPRRRPVKIIVRKTRTTISPAASARISSLENKVRLLESRFREHLEELRKLPSIAHEEKFEEVHKRLDEHDKHRNNLQTAVDELHARHGFPIKTEVELAHDIVDLYFREIARHGFKRSLSLEDTLHAYNFVRKKLKEHKDISASSIEKAIEEGKKEEVKTY